MEPVIIDITLTSPTVNGMIFEAARKLEIAMAGVRCKKTQIKEARLLSLKGDVLTYEIYIRDKVASEQ